MPYHIDEVNSNLTFEVNGDMLIIKAPPCEGGGSKIYIITLEDATEPTDENVLSALRAVNTFLRKDQDDGTEHSLSVGRDLTVGGSHTVGGQQTVKSNQTVKGDSLIEGLLSLVKGASSPDFLAGLLGTGFELRKDAETGRWRLEIDELVVRVVATFFELVIHKLRHVGGSIVLSPGSMQCIRVEETADAYRCYFKASEGDKVVANEFVVGDQVRCQSFNLKAADGGGVKTTFYWRLVTAVGDDYIELSKTDCAAGSDVPAAGDDIVQLGNREDASRQNAIILDTTGSDAPSIKQYLGINGYVLTDEMAMTVFSRTINRIRGQFVSEATGVDYDEAIGAIGEQMQGIKVNVDAIKEQSDKEFTLWFGTVDPTTTNAPASEWTTEEDKAMHLKDIYYNEDAGLAWDWLLGEDGAYYWHSCTDRETLRALEKAAKAQDTADGKRRNFVAQPGKEDAYDVGDTWCNATFGELFDNDTLVCITAKAAGAAFSIEHWRAANTATTAYIKNLGNEIRQVVADNKTAGDLATKAAKDAADAAQKAANDAATAASNAATAASNAQTTANTAATDATKAQTTADTAKDTADKAKSAAAANATAIVQTNTAISTLAGKFEFDENGKVKNIDKSGLVLTSNFASLYSESVNKDTNVVKKADISAMVTKDADGNISSEVKISADQITMTGSTVFAKTSDVANAKKQAVETAATDATTKANTAQSEAEKNAATDAQKKVDALKEDLGDLAYKSMVSSAMLDSTVISGGYIKTSLIDVDNVWVKNLEAKSNDGTTTAKIDGSTGKLTAKQAELDKASIANATITDATMTNATVDGMSAVNADVSGKITASSGQIAGLKIAGNALTNEGFDNDAYIVIRNDSQDRFMGVGANVDPATSSAITLGRYENHTVTGANDLVTNIAIKASAKGGNNGNYALYIRYGNVTGVRHVLRAVSTSTTLNVMDHTVICKHTEGEITITLPSTAENGQEFWMMSANNKNVKVVVGNSAHKIASSGASFASARWHIYIFCSADNTWYYGYTNN